jgi:uncharacterized Zn finger protein
MLLSFISQSERYYRMVITTVLAKVEENRLARGMKGLASGAYGVRVTHQGDREIRGYVKNGDGGEYGVVLNEGQTFCSCPDAMYRKVICKHSIALALFCLARSQQSQRLAA